MNFLERIVEKICYWRWLYSYERTKEATIIEIGDPIFLRIVFDAIVQLVANLVAYVVLAILIMLIILEIIYVVRT